MIRRTRETGEGRPIAGWLMQIGRALVLPAVAMRQINGAVGAEAARIQRHPAGRELLDSRCIGPGAGEQSAVARWVCGGVEERRALEWK